MVHLPPDRTKHYTRALLLLAALALAVCALALGIKQKAVPTQAETYRSYYSPKADASQENGSSGNVSQTPSGAGSPAPTSRPAKSPSPSPMPKGNYVVTVYEGKIGVFQKGEREPFLTADVEVYLLPEEDVKLLKEGIPASTLSEVRGILEDYE